jgi:hypothetical protein
MSLLMNRTSFIITSLLVFCSDSDDHVTAEGSKVASASGTANGLSGWPINKWQHVTLAA